MIFTDSVTQEPQTLAIRWKGEFCVFWMAQGFTHIADPVLDLAHVQQHRRVLDGGVALGLGFVVLQLVNNLKGQIGAWIISWTPWCQLEIPWGWLSHDTGSTLTSLICLLTFEVRKYSGVSRTVVYLSFFFS